MMELLAQLPLPMKAAWIVISLWAVAQFVWYRVVRMVPPPPLPPRRSDSSRRRSAVKKTSPTTVLPTGGSPEFLAELGLHEPDTAPADSVYR